MEKVKMSLANMQGKLSRAEMKKILAGSGNVGCLQKYDYACSTSGAGNSEDQCCSGLKCEMNATNTGTICM